MAVIKQACPKCGQRVSGDESFYGTSVDCPICSSKIFFPDPNKAKQETDKEETAPSSSGDQKQGTADSSTPPPLEDVLDEYQEQDEPEERRSRAPASPAPAPADTGAVASTYDEPPSATLSIVSMVLGILNTITFCFPALVLAPAAIICGHIALIKGKFSPIQPAPGRAMAITGVILGYLGLAVMLITLVLMVTGVFNVLDFIKTRSASGEG